MLFRSQVAVEGEQARVRVAVEMKAVDARTGQTAAGLGKMNRALRCVKESGAWKVWQEGPAEDDLASALLAANNEAQRAALRPTRQAPLHLGLRLDVAQVRPVGAVCPWGGPL